MDSDCVADPGWLENGLRVARAHPEAGIVAGRIELVTSAGASRLCDAYERTFSFNQAKNISNGVAVTANWFSPAEVVRKLGAFRGRSEEHTSELQSLMSISYDVFCLKKKNIQVK